MSSRSRNSTPREIALVALSICLALASGLACEGEASGGYAHQDPEFELLASAREAELRVTVTPVAPWKMNLDFPYSSVATPSTGPPVDAVVTTSAERFVFDHAIAEGSAGPVPVLTRFAVCIEELCKPIDHSFEVAPE